jgi:hypothetical protein
MTPGPDEQQLKTFLVADHQFEFLPDDRVVIRGPAMVAGMHWQRIRT